MSDPKMPRSKSPRRSTATVWANGVWWPRLQAVVFSGSHVLLGFSCFGTFPFKDQTERGESPSNPVTWTKATRDSAAASWLMEWGSGALRPWQVSDVRVRCEALKILWRSKIPPHLSNIGVSDNRRSTNPMISHGLLSFYDHFITHYDIHPSYFPIIFPSISLRLPWFGVPSPLKIGDSAGEDGRPQAEGSCQMPWTCFRCQGFDLHRILKLISIIYIEYHINIHIYIIYSYVWLYIYSYV